MWSLGILFWSNCWFQAHNCNSYNAHFFYLDLRVVHYVLRAHAARPMHCSLVICGLRKLTKRASMSAIWAAGVCVWCDFLLHGRPLQSFCPTDNRFVWRHHLPWRIRHSRFPRSDPLSLASPCTRRWLLCKAPIAKDHPGHYLIIPEQQAWIENLLPHSTVVSHFSMFNIETMPSLLPKYVAYGKEPKVVVKLTVSKTNKLKYIIVVIKNIAVPMSYNHLRLVELLLIHGMDIKKVHSIMNFELACSTSQR